MSEIAEGLRAAQERLEVLERRYMQAQVQRGELVLMARGAGWSLGEIGRHLNITRARVKQIVDRLEAKGTRSEASQ